MGIQKVLMLPAFSLRLTPQRTLRAVLALRGIAVLAQITVLALSVFAFRISLPLGWLLPGTAALAVAGLATGWRLRRDWPVTELEVSLHLLGDVMVLTWVLYFAGGSSNPFVSAYLVPIALAAVALRPRYGFPVIVLSIAAYTALLGFYVPLPTMHQGPASEFAMHVFGMWVSFILSAGLIAGLLWVMAENIRRRDRLIATAREETLRNEHVVALGSLAAAAAHELSTPLSTVALVADELAAELKGKPGLQDDVALLRQQVQQCKTSLSTLLASVGHGRVESGAATTVDALLEQTLARWRLLRPEIALTATLTGDTVRRLLPEQGLAQALINLLNNAADASAAAGQPQIHLWARLDGEQLVIEIHDQGAGFDEIARQMAGRAAFSTKPGGSGLGLLLSNSSLSRLGGTLNLQSGPKGGTLTRIALPLSRLEASA